MMEEKRCVLTRHDAAGFEREVILGPWNIFDDKICNICNLSRPMRFECGLDYLPL